MCMVFRQINNHHILSRLSSHLSSRLVLIICDYCDIDDDLKWWWMVKWRSAALCYKHKNQIGNWSVASWRKTQHIYHWCDFVVFGIISHQQKYVVRRDASARGVCVKTNTFYSIINKHQHQHYIPASAKLYSHWICLKGGKTPFCVASQSSCLIGARSVWKSECISKPSQG